jgi:hypothetical protein
MSSPDRHWQGSKSPHTPGLGAISGYRTYRDRRNRQGRLFPWTSFLLLIWGALSLWRELKLNVLRMERGEHEQFEKVFKFTILWGCFQVCSISGSPCALQGKTFLRSRLHRFARDYFWKGCGIIALYRNRLEETR